VSRLPFHLSTNYDTQFSVSDKIKTLSVLICLRSQVKKEFTPDCHIDLLTKAGVDMSGLSDQCRVLPVAKCTPLTRVQYEMCSQLWPSFFHEDKV